MAKLSEVTEAAIDIELKCNGHTPFTIRVPTLVTKPLTHSDLNDERTSVEPGSFGASKATHSSRPLFNDARVSWNELRSHSSSRAYETSEL